MYFFNINAIFRNLKYILKYLTILFFFILFFIFLFFITTCRAETIDDLTNTINSAIDNIQEIQNGANWCVGLFDDGNYYMLTCASYGVGNNSFANYVQNNKNYIFCTDSTYRLSRRGGTNYYTLTSNGYTFYGEDNTNHRLNLNANSLYYSSIDVHYENSNSVYFQATEVAPSFIPPSFVNYEDSNWNGTLVNGEFNYFYINGNSVNSVYLYFYDTTYGVGDDDSVVWGAILDENSQYVLHDVNGGIYWAFNKTIPFGGYRNSRDYKLVIQYFDNNNISQSLDYTWTTDFSQAVIDGEWDNGLADINKGIQDTNNFLSSDKINNADFDLPEINVNDFTAGFFTTLVGSITNAFIDTTYDESITFEVRGKSYTINSQQFDILSSVGLGVLKNFTALFWVFGVGYWIFCDARMRISRLREFNWQSMFADDISVNML